MGSRTKHLTAIAMDKNYPVESPFEFFHCWEYLSENTNLLVTGAVIGDPVAEVGAGGAVGDGQAAAPPGAGTPVVGAADAAPPRQERPQGVKAAKVKNGRKRKLKGTDDGEDKEASAIIARMDKIADSLDMEAMRKKESDQHHCPGEGEVLVAAAVAAAVGRNGTAGRGVPARVGRDGGVCRGGGGCDGGGGNAAAGPGPPLPRQQDGTGCGGEEGRGRRAQRSRRRRRSRARPRLRGGH